MMKYEAITIKPAEPNSPIFKALCGLPPSFTRTKNVPIMDIIIPTAASTKGRYTAPNPAKSGVIINAPKTMVPIIEPT